MKEQICNPKKVMKEQGKRILAIMLIIAMISTSPAISAQAFSLGGFISSISSSISSAVDKIKNSVETSSSKTVNNWTELNNYVSSSYYAPKDITVKLGANITIPSNAHLSTLIHNVTMDLNGHTLYSNTGDYSIYVSYGKVWKIKNGTIVVNRDNMRGLFNMSSGDLFLNNITLKSASASNATVALREDGLIGSSKVTMNDVRFEKFTTAIQLGYSAVATGKNITVKNSQGNAIEVQSGAELTLNDSTVQYSKGHGLYTASYYNKDTTVTLNSVKILNGTTRNRYGIYAAQNSYNGKKANISLTNCEVVSNAGGNIAAFTNSSVHITNIDQGKYSFTTLSAMNGSTPNTVATYGSGKLTSVNSDISRYMITENGTSSIAIKNPPAQVNVTTEFEAVGKLHDRADNNFASLSLNGGKDVSSAENATASAIYKYGTKISLSTTCADNKKYQFKRWVVYTKEKESDSWQEAGTIQELSTKVEPQNEYTKYVAEYDCKQYKITAQQLGGGSVSPAHSDVYAGETVTLTATAASGTEFVKWSDGVTSQSRTVTATKNMTYIALFKKTGNTEGTMYLGVQEHTSMDTATNKNLLLIYVGSVGDSQKNSIETSNGNVGTTGLPAYSAQVTSQTITTSHGRTQATGVSGVGITGYGYDINPQSQSLLSVQVVQRAEGFDSCTAGYIGYFNTRGSNNWLYWCNGGGVKNVGPYRLYSYTKKLTFNVADVKVKMKQGFRPSNGTDTVGKNEIVATVTVGNTEYELVGLKFDVAGLDKQVNYTQGDKLITFMLDDAVLDYTFPDATVGEKEYTKLNEALTSVNSGQIIKIVGPGVDAIDPDHRVTIGKGTKIEGYDGDTYTAKEESKVAVDANGDIRLLKGTLDATPETVGDKVATAGVGEENRIVTINKPATICVEKEGDEPQIVSQEDGAVIKVYEEANAGSPSITISDAKKDKSYGPDSIHGLDGEQIEVAKDTSYKVVVVGKNADGEDVDSEIIINGHNAGTTTITSSSDGKPVISMSEEGDKFEIGGKFYSQAGKTNTSIAINTDLSTIPSVEIISGGASIPEGASAKLPNSDIIIKNTGVDSSESSPISIGADGSVELPDAGGATIIAADGSEIKIEVPHDTPLNNNTKITFNDDGTPQITTTGTGKVALTIGDEKVVYKAGDYDMSLHLNPQGYPVIDDGEVALMPGQVVVDREGNLYQCPKNGGGISIGTTPQVYDDGELIGGGSISMELPEGGIVGVLPAEKAEEFLNGGDVEFIEFENPGTTAGSFTLEPEQASEGIKSDSGLTLGAGKGTQLAAGNGNSMEVKVPEEGNKGAVQIDGAKSQITVEKKGDKVLIDDKTYTAGSDNTQFTITGYGVELTQGSSTLKKGTSLIANGAEISGDGVLVEIKTENDIQNVEVTVAEGETFGVGIAGDASTKVTYTATGDKTYAVDQNGGLQIPAEDSISVKVGKTPMLVTAKDSPVTFTPLAKPNKDEAAGGEDVLVQGGLLVSTVGDSLTIGGNTYLRGELGDGSSKVPMELLIDTSDDVVLQNGAVKLENGSAISLYDVSNVKTKFTNTSKDADKPIKVSKPGVVTMAESDTTIKMTAGKESVEFTTKSEDTEIAYTKDLCILKKGSVELDQQEKILVGNSVVKNTSKNADKKVVATIVETPYTQSVDVVVYEEDGSIAKNPDGTTKTEKKEVTAYKTTGTIVVEDGGSFSASAVDAEGFITYQSNVDGGDGSSTFTINEDGNIILPDGGFVNVSSNVKVQAGGNGIETMPTAEGVLLAIPKGQHITIDGHTYTNVSEEPLVMSVTFDGKVILEQGKVELGEGNFVYVKGQNNKLVPIENKKQSESGDGHTITVSYDAPEETVDENGVSVWTYSQVDVKAPEGASVGIGTFVYDEIMPEQSKTEAHITIAMDTTAAPGTASYVDPSRIVLESGSLNLGALSEITVKGSQDSKKQVTNSSKANDGNVKVQSDATVVLDNGAQATVKSNGQSNTIAVPSVSDDEMSAYEVKIDLDCQDNGVDVTIQPENGNGTVGAGKSVIINDATYTSVQENQNLQLSIDNGPGHDVELIGSSSSVDVLNGKIKVGDTYVTVTDDKPVTVNTVGNHSKLDSIVVPEGGEANVLDEMKDMDIAVKVPERTEDGDTSSAPLSQKFTMDEKTDTATGNKIPTLTTELEENEKVIIGGVEYTGKVDGEIEVSANSGELIKAPENGAPDMSIDTQFFDKEDYTFALDNNASVTVGDTNYQVTEGSSVVLNGNPNGNPIITISKEGDSIIVGNQKFIAKTPNTKLIVNSNGSVTLLDNTETPNSTIQATGADKLTINGATYAGTKEDSYTVAYGATGDVVSVADGSKVTISPAKGKTIYIENLAVESKDEEGTKTYQKHTLPIKINASNANFTVSMEDVEKDSEVAEYMGFLTVSNNAQMKIVYGEDETVPQTIVIEQKKTSSGIKVDTPSTEKPVNKEPQKVELNFGGDKNPDGTTETEKVTVTGVVEDKKVVLDAIEPEVVEKIVKVDDEGKKTVSLDLKKTEESIVVLPKQSISNIAEAADGLVIDVKGATVEIDNVAMSSIASQASGNEVEIKVSEMQPQQLNNAQLETVKEQNVEVHFEATIISNNQKIHTFDNGKILVGIYYDIPEGRTAEDYNIYYLDTEGKLTHFGNKYENGAFWFTTEHFSEYIITYDGEEANDSVQAEPLNVKKAKVTKSSIKLTWKKSKEVEKYVVYMSTCSKNKLKKVAEVKGNKTSYTAKKLKKATGYKFVIQACMKDGSRIKSKAVYVTTAGGKYGDAKAVCINKIGNKKINSLKTVNVTLKKGKSVKVTASEVDGKKAIKKYVAIRFESSNNKIATVTKTGKIVAKKAGTCKINVYAQNGVYTTISVTVK